MLTINYEHSYLGAGGFDELGKKIRRQEEKVEIDNQIIPLIIEFCEGFFFTQKMRPSNEATIRIDTPGVVDESAPYVEIMSDWTACNLTFNGNRLAEIFESEFEGPSKITAPTFADETAVEPIKKIVDGKFLPLGTHLFSVRLG